MKNRLVGLASPGRLLIAREILAGLSSSQPADLLHTLPPPSADMLLEFSSLFKYEEQNDRALVIVGAAFLDTLLEHILINFLIDDTKEVAALLHYDQPLGTFGGRTRVAYCLGLINKTMRDDLRFVGKIRNRFAHDLYASFGDQDIQSWCMALKWHRTHFMPSPPDASGRELFYVGLNQLVTHLNGIVSRRGFARDEQERSRGPR